MNVMPITELIDKVTEICKANGVKRLDLFGSFATGTTTDTSDVDFVVTFEELQAMFDAKEIDLTEYEAESSFHDATGAGRGYGCAGGVAEAIEKCINEYYPDVQVNIEHAEGLKECKKILTLAKAGKMNGCLIEGMGCPGGCVAGAGTNIPVVKAQIQVKKFVKEAEDFVPPETAQY